MAARTVVVALAAALSLVGACSSTSRSPQGEPAGSSADTEVELQGQRILYVDDRNDRIVSVKTDGTDLITHFVSQDRAIGSFAVSPDRTRLAIAQASRTDSGYPWRLVLAPWGKDVTDVSTVVPDSDAHYGRVTWSPDGSRLLFKRQDPAHPNHSFLYSISPTGANLREIAADIRAFALSPNGQQIAYVAEDRRLSLGIMRIDGTHARTVYGDGGVLWVDWSPHGSQLLLEICTDCGAPDLFVMDANGSALTAILVTPDVWESTPSWSPDGERIVFGQRRDLWTMDVDGGEPIRLTDDRSWNAFPQWVAF